MAGDHRDEDRGRDRHDHGQDEQDGQHQRRDGRGDPPRSRLLVGRQQAGDDRDQGRAEGAGRDQLEDEVGNPEGGQEGVEVGGRPERRTDHDEADRTEDARHEERARDDQPGPGNPR